MPETTDIDDDVFQYEGSEMSQCISGFGRNALELIEDVATRHKDMDPEDAERVRWHVGELVRWCRHFNGKSQRLKRSNADLLEAARAMLSISPECRFGKGVDGKEYHLVRGESGDELGHTREQCVWCALRAAIAAAEGRQPE
jgi:hypothetical protein